MGDLQQYKGWGEEQLKEDDAAMAGGGSNFWKAEEGRNLVRFLPALADWDSPFMIIPEHYVRIGEKTHNFACPRATMKRACPVCEKANELYQTGHDRDQKAAQKLFVKKQVYANIIDRKNEDKGPQVFKFGKTIWDGLKEIREDPDVGGDFTNPKTGFDIIIKRKGTGIKTEYKVLPGKSRKLGNMDWINEQPAQRRIIVLESEQISGLLSGGNEDEDMDDAVDW